MANTVYENTVLESKLTELVDSKIEVRALMSVDKSLEEGAGLTKVINRYTYRGSVETLDGGQANTNVGELTFTPKEYKVKRYQQTFRYNDMEAMQDPAMIDIALSGIADVMANQVRGEYFGELKKTSNRHAYSGNALSYGDVVDALAALGREVEDGLFIIMSAACRAAIRRDSDFIAAHSGEIVYTGQFGTLCGVPVLFSALVPDGMAIITDRNAVKFFVKREASLEQDRDIETKINTVVYERCGLIALVDDTSTVILGKKAADITASVSSGTLTVSGKKTSSDDIYWRKADFAALGGEDVSSWNKWDGSSKLDAAAGERISVAEAGTDGLSVASAVVTAA